MQDPAGNRNRVPETVAFQTKPAIGAETIIGAQPVCSFQERGRVARRAGTKTKVATRVHPRLTRSSAPMLAVPGCRDSASEPNAVAVVRAENKTARAVAELSGALSPARQFMTK